MSASIRTHSPGGTLPYLSRGAVRLEVLDSAGRRVATVLDEEMAEGDYRIPWTASPSLASGVYYLRLTAEGDYAVYWSRSREMLNDVNSFIVLLNSCRAGVAVIFFLPEQFFPLFC